MKFKDIFHSQFSSSIPDFPLTKHHSKLYLSENQPKQIPPMKKDTRHIPLINYRNAIYEGGFNFALSQRQGFGILYLTTRHEFIASHWSADRLSGHTLIFMGPRRYMYGSWESGQPNGSIYARFGQNVVICQYDDGSIKEKIIVISEKYNVAAVVKLTIDPSNRVFSEIVSKGELFTKQHLDEFIFQCDWENFSYSYETLVKYISENLLTKAVHIELINNYYYRFGFQKGLAITFDDQYKIKTVGWHRHNELKGLGLRHLDQDSLEEGNWGRKGEVFSYCQKIGRPNGKIEKVYRCFHLKAINFQNKILTNDAEAYLSSTQEIVKGDVGKQVISGVIYSKRNSTFNSIESQGYQSNIDKSKQDAILERLTQDEKERIKLEMIKEEIYDSIRKKKVYEDLKEMENDSLDGPNVISDRYVEKESSIRKSAVRNRIFQNTPTRDMGQRVRSRGLIVQQSKSPTAGSVFSQEPRQQLSPFAKKMRSRLFPEGEVKKNIYTIPTFTDEQPNHQFSKKNIVHAGNKPKKHKQIFEESIRKSQLPKIVIKEPKEKSHRKLESSRVVDLRQYESPFDHLNLNVTHSKAQMHESAIEALPLSMKSQHLKKDYIKIEEENKSSSEMGPRAHFGKKIEKSPIRNNVQSDIQQMKCIEEEMQALKKKEDVIVSPYHEREIRQKYDEINEQRKSMTPEKAQTRTTKKSKCAKEKERPFFPVHNNSAYLKQHQNQVYRASSPPQHQNVSNKHSPYHYFKQNVPSQNQSKNKRLEQPHSQNRGKVFYDPINVNSPPKYGSKDSRSRSRRKTDSYQEQFRRRMSSSPENRYSSPEREVIKLTAIPEKYEKKRVPQYGDKVIHSSTNRAGYNYYFQ